MANFRCSIWLAASILCALATGMPQKEGKKEVPVEKPDKVTKKNADTHCLTPGCVLAAADLLRNIDDSVDPCDDFYEFSCGKYIKETIIPDHKTSKGAFGDLRDQLNERMRLIFEGKSVEESEPQIFGDVRNYYASCTNESRIDSTSADELKTILSKLGGWPVLMGDKWSDEGFQCHKIVEKAAGLGMNQDVIVSLGIATDDSNSSRRIIEIDQPSFGQSREYLIKGFEDNDVQAYYKYMVALATYLGADKEVAEKEMKDVVLMEIDLANMALPKEERRNKTALFNHMKISEAEEMMEEGFDLTSHINSIFQNMVPETTVEVTKDEVVNVAVPSYIKNLTAYMAEADSRTVANYMLWRYVKFLVPTLDKTVLDYKLDYEKVIKGKKQRSPRWEDCVKTVGGIDSSYLYFYEGSLSNAVGAMYAKRYFPLEEKEIADEMVVNIRNEFKLMLDELSWMDEKTKEKARLKADQMASWMAYAKEILDDDLQNEFYEGLRLDSASFMTNYLNLRKFINAYYIKNLRELKDKSSWKTHGGAAIVNAFYSSEENSIQFPAGILNGVFFRADRPQYMNYGGIGWVVGHEITHGFDDQGSQKDGEGNLVDWWEPETKENYLEKAKCIIDQYAAFNETIVPDDGGEVEVLNINGINTQGENIADNGGVKEAMRAYERLVAESGPEPLLPGLKYNQRQLFWLSGAAIWCNTRRPASLKNQILIDPHSPARYRVNVPYSNLPAFARDWKCPKGSKMNPEKKCAVW